MGMLDRKYREGVREYILGLTVEKKKEFEYQLYCQINTHRRVLRDLKEELREEIAALAFLQAEMYVLPFKKRESGAVVALTEEKEIIEEKHKEAV